MPKALLPAALLALALFAPGAAIAADLAKAKSDLILVEAEGFASRGGWVVDSQFMDIMGSPYLLAHGLGRPVKDAVTQVVIPAGGKYRVWVRTKDWVAQWKAPGAPGRFQLLVNGSALGGEFGVEGAEWHWQDGGLVELPAGATALALHDLTGFEGRCDAILLARDLGFTPPNKEPALGALRRRCLGIPDQPEVGGAYDFVVTGGGIAGTCAALSAARLGLKVALIQDRPVLGGNNGSEVRVALQGARNEAPWPNVGNVVAELEPDKRAAYGPANTKEIYEDEKKLAVVLAEKNLTLLLEYRVNGVEASDGRIAAVIAQSTISGRRLRIAGRWFADCTGDASVGELAGADFEMEPKGRLGPCNIWSVCECKDTTAIGTGAEASAGPEPFPRCPWALDLADKPFPGRSKTKPDPSKLGGWYWESGFDRDPITETEYIRDWNFRAMYGAWDALKNVDKALPNYRLNWCAFILGKRESRRLLGDVILTLDDLKSDRHFPDGAAPTGWSNDLHLSDPRYEKGFEGDAFISHADFGEYPAHKANRPFWIPYRCFYSRNISNLFMAGRDISVKHEALGAVRVMRTCGDEGEIVGMAAGLCGKYDISPRDVYEHHLSELQDLMRFGAGKVDGKRIDYVNSGQRHAKTSAAKTVPKIRVERSRHGFVDAAGKPFVPFGVTYYRPGTGWAPQLWKQFDAEATRRDFARLKRQGANVVRVFISFGSFLTEPGKLNPEGLSKFDQLLDLADEAGLYVHPAGPDGWEGMPPWTNDLNVFSNDTNGPCLKALEDFWRLFAARYRGRSTIWAYDLRNEPHLAWDTPFLRRQWAAWREAHHQKLAPVPDPEANPLAPELADYQRFRESIVETWVARQSRTIKAADPDALVTVGLLQWSIPAQRMRVDQYTAFRPTVIAKHLDFLELHYYPLVSGVYDYDGHASETANLAVLEAMTRECAKPGLPLVIAEFGWYGGGPLTNNGKPATEEQQAEWCRHLLEVTSPMACGWLNWGMYDDPQANDVSKLTGLFTVDGKEKAWGRAFRDVSKRFRASPPAYMIPRRPDLPWVECTASGDEMEKFRQAYLAAFIAKRNAK